MKSFVLDEEIDLLESKGNGDSESDDLLNTMPYVETLAECVMNAPENKSFNIGLFGEWGSGKSSIIKTFDRLLTERFKDKGKIVKVITYDAWKYSNDSFRRMFLLHMQQELGFEREELMNKFYLNSSEDAHIDTRFDKNTFFIGTIIILTAILGIVKFTDFPTDWKIISTAFVSLCALGYSILKGIFQEVKVTIQRPHLFAPEQFEECFNEMCQKAYSKDGHKLNSLKWIKCEKGATGIDRLVIVIDNVDRCSSELAYELLTNIKNFLSCKNNIIFIIPVDEDALKRHFEPQEGNKQNDSAEFLRKFFNICLRIKPFKRDELFDFADAINKKYDLGFNPITVSLVANEFAHNPRRIIQMFNNLNVEIQSLPKEYDEKYQALICLLLIIREEYPVYYKIIQNDSLNLFSKEGRAGAPDDVKSFLGINSAVIDSFTNDLLVVERILSNTPMEGRVPQTLKDDYQRMEYREESLEYLADYQHRTDLIHYIENRLKLSIERQLWETDVKNNIDRLLALNNAVHLTKEESVRVTGMMTESAVFGKIASNQTDLRFLIDYASQLESQGVNNLSDSIIGYIKNSVKDGSNKNACEDVWYAYSKLAYDSVKTLGEVALISCNINFTSIISQEYGSEKSKLVFTDEIIKQVLLKMQSDEDKVVEVMEHIASSITLSNSNLVEYVQALDAVTPQYNYSKNNTPELQKRLRALNNMLNLCKDSTLKGDDVECLKVVFLKYSDVKKVQITRNYQQVSTRRGFILDNIHQPVVIHDVLSFFKLSSLITGEIIVPPGIVSIIQESRNYDTEITDDLYELLATGYPIEQYSDQLIKIESYSDNHLHLLDYLLKLKKADNTYYITDEKVRSVFEKLLATAIGETNENTALIGTIRDIAEDSRNAGVLSSLLLSKDKEWLLSLPNELRGYAISVFADNVEEYKEQQNILTLLASKGDSKARKAVVRIANAKINDDQKRADGLEIIKSFESLSASDAKPLITSLEFIKDNNPKEAKSVNDCLLHLESIKTTRVAKKNGDQLDDNE